MSLLQVVAEAGVSPAGRMLQDFLDASLKYMAVAGGGALVSQFFVGRRLGKKIDANDAATKAMFAAMEARQAKLEAEMHGPRGVQETLEGISQEQQRDHDLLIQIGTKMEAFSKSIDGFSRLIETFLMRNNS